MEASPVAIIVTDLGGTIQLVNHVAESWFGYKESELLGKPSSVLFQRNPTGDDVSHDSCVLSRAGDNGQGDALDRYGRPRKGVPFAVKVTLHPLSLTTGEMVLANVVNLSQNEPEYEKRIQGERLAAVLEMVSGLAHESRNALQRAQSCLDLLELEITDQSDLLHLTDRIRGALTDLHQNYEEVKRYAAPIILKITAVDFRRLCEKSFAALVLDSSNATPRLRIDECRGCSRLQVDQLQMAEVLRNVFENAIQASLSDSEIDCSCRMLEHEWVEICIRDHGVGLTEEVSRRMFEPFFTTKQKGTGLGLAVCQRIIAAHQGQMSARNHPDGGVEVRILLPMAKSTSSGK
ncbi:Sensor protein FixL [Rubripirellula tenax]|uniref:histidine kinase n=1 Tax=Rubripirellula tenax TaxID=2528015 RepID=A0A5C6EDR3_9BACT|nr:ATP-binding protein [Rubripirellula tenax]TWU46137.1 Sensor protein FixL [Rubripirellula tenax]